MTRSGFATHVPASTARNPVRRRILLAGGIGGIAAFCFWLLQPLLVFVVLGEASGAAPTYEQRLAAPFLGTYEALTFGGVAVGLLTLVLAVEALARSAEASLVTRMGTVFGIAAAVAWLFAAALSLVPFTSVGFSLAEMLPDAAQHGAVYESVAFVITATLLAYGLAMIGWLVVLATSGRRAGVVGWPLAILAIVAAVAACLPLVMPFSPPFGMIGPLGFALVIGVVFLLRARRP